MRPSERRPIGSTAYARRTLNEHSRPPERAEDVVLDRGEKLVFFRSYGYDGERQILLLFGVLLAGCLVGLVLLYFWMSIRRRAPRAVAITSSRILYWKGDQAPVVCVISDLARVVPLRPEDAGTNWIALLASGQRGRLHTKDPVWNLARGLVITSDRLDTIAVTIPFDDAEKIGPLLAERVPSLPRGDGRHSNEHELVRESRTPERMREARGPHGATLLHLAIREDVVGALLEAGLDPNALDARGRNPLMYEKSPAAIRALAAAGTDPRHTDASGANALALRATPPPELRVIGFAPPDYDALEALLSIGVPGPSLPEAKEWLARADAVVCAAGEASDAQAFGRWLAHAVVPAPGRP